MADDHLVEEHGSEDVELTDAVVEKDDQPASMQVDIANLTEEELDHIADTAIDALQGILKYFDVGEVMIDEYEGDERELILDITGDNLAVLVDVEGYKNRQRQKIESLARSAASRADQQHKAIKLRPMTPYERRIVHIALRDDDRVETASEGEGSSRHVVVLPRS